MVTMDRYAMFNLLPVKGHRYSRKTKQQINSLNKILKAMNQVEVDNPVKLIPLYEKLVTFHRKKIRSGSAKPAICGWFAAHPLFRIDKIIKQLIKAKKIESSIMELSQQIDMIEIYKRYEGKDSFRTLVQKQLHQVDDTLEITNLGGGNNPVVRVKLDDDHSFIMRFLRVNSQDEKNKVSPRFLRENLEDIEELPKPYLLLPVEDDYLETTYLEFSPYFERGSLVQLFQHLHAQKGKNTLDPNQLLLLYAQKIIDFYIRINNRNIWYTDLKPENILLPILPDTEHVVLSDIKGLVLSHTNKIARNKVNVTPAYFQSSVYENKEIHLDLLQRQNLANTLYELACGKLPIPAITHQPDWKNKYDFEQPCFQTPEGVFLKKLIRELNKSKALPLTHFMQLISDFEEEQIKSYMKTMEKNQVFVPLEDSYSHSNWEF